MTCQEFGFLLGRVTEIWKSRNPFAPIWKRARRGATGPRRGRGARPGGGDRAGRARSRGRGRGAAEPPEEPLEEAEAEEEVAESDIEEYVGSDVVADSDDSLESEDPVVPLDTHIDAQPTPGRPGFLDLYVQTFMSDGSWQNEERSCGQIQPLPTDFIGLKVACRCKIPNHRNCSRQVSWRPTIFRNAPNIKCYRLPLTLKPLSQNAFVSDEMTLWHPCLISYISCMNASASSEVRIKVEFVSPSPNLPIQGWSSPKTSKVMRWIGIT